MRGRHRKNILMAVIMILGVFVITPSVMAVTNEVHQAMGLNLSDSDKTEVQKHVKVFKVKKSGAAKTTGASSDVQNGTAIAPCQVDWSYDMPTPGNQGRQSSCVGWSMAYAYRSYQEEVQRTWGLTTASHQFSPAYVYNQINGGSDNGASPVAAANLLVNQGCDTLADMPYSATDYKTQPSDAQKTRATYFKSANWASVDLSNSQTMIDNLKAALTNTPLQTGVYVYWKTGWDSTGDINAVDLAKGTYAGSHSIILVGYDDNHITADGTGAFKFINSWGTGWGKGGYGWISYTYAQKKLIEAIAITDVTNDPLLDAYSLSGNVKSSDGNALNGVVIDFSIVSGSGNLPASTTTDTSGVWNQRGFEGTAIYRITPLLNGYDFNPQYIDVGSQPAGAASQDFTACVLYKASGQISLSSGMSAFPDTTMTFTRINGTGSIPDPVKTDVNGAWSQSGFAAGTTYRVTPSSSGVSFAPFYAEFCSQADTAIPSFSCNQEAPAISITAPAGGSNLYTGASQIITWTYSGTIGNINIQLLSGGQVCSCIATGISSNNGTGSYKWPIPASLSPGTYQIMLQSTLDNTISATSDDFSMTSAGESDITITSPSAASNWTTGSNNDIQWTYTGNINKVNIQLLRNGSVYKRIANNVAASKGTYQWTIPLNLSQGNYQIKVVNSNNNQIYSISDQFLLEGSVISGSGTSSGAAENGQDESSLKDSNDREEGSSASPPAVMDEN